MADNVTLNPGAAGDVIAADDVGGAKYQRVKISVGGDGSATDVGLAAPLPVQLSDGSGAITALPISLSTLPAGTNNIGDVDVLSVVPGTGATNLGKAEDSPHTSGDVGVMALGVQQSADSAMAADGDYVPFQIDESGRLKVVSQPASYTATTGTITANGQTVFVNCSRFSNLVIYCTGTFSTVNVTFEASINSTNGTDGNWFAVQAARTNSNTVELTTGNLSAAPAYAWELSVNAYAFFRVRATAYTSGTQTWTFEPGAYATEPVPVIQPISLAASQTLATVTTVATVTNITNQGHLADDAAFTVATTRVMMAGFLADETSTDSVDEGDGGAARITLDRKQIVTPYVHAGAGGATPYQNLDVDESEDEVKGTAGKVFWVHAMNMTASVVYLKFYNATAASVTVGTTTPVLTFPLPTNANTNGAGFAINFGDVGVQFSTAITIAATTGFAVADTGAPAANAVIVNLGYI